MKSQWRKYSLFATLLAMSLLLTGCGSGSNTGVWIAIIVMVFVAVFAATSGVVYLVLQRVLPPEEEQQHSVRPVQHRTEEIDDVTSRPPLRASTHRTQAAAQNRGTEWICPRDHTRNTGPYCTACGDSRPQRQAASQPARQAAVQTVRRTENAPQIRQGYASAAPQTRTQTSASAGTVQMRPQSAPQQERAYTGKFARKEPQAVSSQEASAAEEPEYDAELLAAIFREAEQGDSEA